MTKSNRIESTSKNKQPSPRPSPRGRGRPAVYAIFFLSGAAALTYEISWSRQIGLLFGNTASAAATVLASYFIGLALGYALAGRLAAKAKRPLLLYGVLEWTAALWALLVPWLLSLLEAGQLASWLHDLSPLARMTVRAVLCVLLFLPATTALGGTLPLMARWVESRDTAGASRIAWAYGLNTFGGLVGVLVATIYLLSNIGVVASSYLAAATSAACGFAAITLAHIVVDRSAINIVVRGANHDDRTIPLLVGVSGFLTLALEVLYTRLFALTFHNSTYTFGLVVAVVLFGLAAGAWLASWSQRRADALAVAGWAFLIGGAAIAFSTLLFLNQTGLSYFRGGDSFAHYMTASVGLVAVVVLPPATLLGMVLPLLWDASCRMGFQARPTKDACADLEVRTTTAAVVGRLTAINTLSAAVGALAASFLLLPTLGLWNSFAALIIVCIVASISLLAPRASLAYWAALIAACCLAIAAWRVTTLEKAVPENKTLFRRSEGAYGWIDVLQHNRTGALSLRENINYTHGSTASATWERRQSHIPLLLHPQPADVLFLGCGTGATAGGAVLHDQVQSITIAELIPEVIDAARMFRKSNLDVFDDPRTQVHIDDARHYLLATDRRFDVIIADLFVPWESKAGYLYTVDHYQIVRRRLNPGGLFCHWLPMWQLGEREFEMVVEGFASVFPNTTLWWGKVEYDRSIIGLIGSEQPLTIDGDQTDQRLQCIYAAGPQDARLNRPSELARRYIGSWQVQSGALLNTDEHPRLEFTMPLTYANRDTLKLSTMQAYFDRQLAKLPQDGIDLIHASADAATPDARRDWQRLQLRK